MRKVEADEHGNIQQGLAYKDMQPKYYYSITILFWGLILIGSVFIPSVDEIFEIIGVVCVNCIAFLFPGFFYLSASKKYHASNRTETLSKFEPGQSYIARNKVLEYCARG